MMMMMMMMMVHIWASCALLSARAPQQLHFSAARQPAACASASVQK
jgi:hypothetical protein